MNFEAQRSKTGRKRNEAEKLVAKPKIIRHTTNGMKKELKLNSLHFTIHQRGGKWWNRKSKNEKGQIAFAVDGNRFRDGFGGWNVIEFVWLRKKTIKNSVKCFKKIW